jgi:hypothetical protein
MSSTRPALISGAGTATQCCPEPILSPGGHISAPQINLPQLLQCRQLHQLPLVPAVIVRQAQTRQLAEVRDGSSARTVAKAAMLQLQVAQLLQAAG